VNDLDAIHEMWGVRKNDYTIDVLRDWYNVDKKYAFGIFCKTTGAPLSNCMRLSYSGWIGVLQTAESARGKGYAKLLVKKIAKLLAEDSIEPCIDTPEFNKASLAVFRSVGFEHIYDCVVQYHTRTHKTV